VGVLSTVRGRLATWLSPATSHTWWPVVHEPYTGAWQLNDPITAQSALSNPSVFGCVSAISADIGKTAPPLLLEEDAHGFWFETSNSAYTPVLRTPNRYQTAQQFIEQIVVSLLLYGNAYLLKNRDDRGVVNQLYVLDASRVKVLAAPDGSVYYELQPNELAGITNAEPPIIAPAREIIHIRINCFFHPLMGVSPLYAVAGAVAQAHAIQTNSTGFFNGGGRSPFAVIAPTKLDPLSAGRLQAEATKFKTSGTMILELGVQLVPMPTSAADTQLIAQLGWTEETIAKCFRFPISLLNSAKQPPYANAEASQLQYKACLEPYMTSIATGLTTGLELPRYLKVEFDDTLLTWMDTATRVNAAKIAITAGMSPNEVRDTYFGLPPVEGGELPYLQQQNWPVAELAGRQGVPAAPSAPLPTEEQVAATVGEMAQS
jgi:HK97 family phage portal protein